MELLHDVAVLLLSLFAYSAGGSAASAAEPPRPRAADVAAAPLVALSLLLAAPAEAKVLGLVAAVLGGFVSGLAVERLVAASPAGGPAGPEPRPAGRGGADGRQYLLRVGSFQGRLFLSLFYFLVMPPFALAARLGRDTLRLRGSRESPSTHWRTAAAPDEDEDPHHPY